MQCWCDDDRAQAAGVRQRPQERGGARRTGTQPARHAELEAAKVSEVIDRRMVVNPCQAWERLTAVTFVGHQAPSDTRAGNRGPGRGGLQFTRTASRTMLLGAQDGPLSPALTSANEI